MEQSFEPWNLMDILYNVLVWSRSTSIKQSAFSVLDDFLSYLLRDLFISINNYED